MLKYENEVAVSKAEMLIGKSSESYVAFIKTARGAVGYCSRHIERLMKSGASQEMLEAETKILLRIYRTIPLCNYRNIFVTGPGWYVDSFGWKPSGGYNPTEHDYYCQAIQNPNDNVCTTPYVSVIDGVEEFTITRAMGDTAGTVVGIDITVKMLQTLVNDIRLDGAMCAMVLAGDGQMIEHHLGGNEKENHDLNLEAIAAQAMKESGSFKFLHNGKQWLQVISVPLTIGGRVIVMGDERMFGAALSLYHRRVFAGVVIIFLVTMIFVYLTLRRIRHHRENEIVAAERARQAEALEVALNNTRLANQKLTEQKKLLDYFMGTFELAYFVNLVDDTFEILHASPVFADFSSKYGDSQKLLNAFISFYIHPDDRAMMTQITDKAYVRSKLKEAPSFTYMVRIIVANHEKTLRGIILCGADQDHVAVGFTDISEDLHKEQEQQRQLQEALRVADIANKSKTNFLFNMSHDIRTPMNAIIGFTNMAIKHIKEESRVMDCLVKIQHSGNMLLSLINSVLEVSRIESGHATLDEQHGNVRFSFVDIESTLRTMVETKDIKLSFEFGTITDEYITCDINRCIRVLVNVISNAIKYTHDGGFVKVRCEQLEGIQNGCGNYRYTVTDNGIGMSEEFQKHVFEQFSREKNATTSGIQGTGLGMAVCKSFVDLMGGTIECQSKQGQGTTFIITMPFKIQKTQIYTDPNTGEVINSAGTRRTREKKDFTGKRVLLVEDNELNREIAVELLEDEKFKVEEAENGAIAVEKVKEKGPSYYDFILMDIQMPVMNGYEATKAIRELFPDASLPIIAVSANAFEEDKAASVAAGMNDHVAKPIKSNELFKTIEKYL